MPAAETRARPPSTDRPGDPRRRDPRRDHAWYLAQDPRGLERRHPIPMGFLHAAVHGLLLPQAMSYIGQDGDVSMRAMTQTPVAKLGEPSTHACPECRTPFRRAMLPFRFEGRLLGYFPADVCENGHEYFTEESGAAIQAAVEVRRKRRLRGREITPSVGRPPSRRRSRGTRPPRPSPSSRS